MIGEGAEEVDLVVGERLDFAAERAEHPDDLALTDQWHPEHRPESADRQPFLPAVFRIREYVGDLHRPRFECNTPHQERATRLHGDGLLQCDQLR